MIITNTQNLIFVLIAAGIILLIAVTLEILNARQRLYWRLTSLVCSLMALLALIFRPALPVTTYGNEGIILTSGYDHQLFDSITSAQPDLRVVHWDTAGHDTFGFQRAHLLGTGLPWYDLWRLEGKDVRYYPPDAPDGIIRLKYDHHLKEGENLVLQGEFNNIKGMDLWLRLRGPAGVVDSSRIERDGVNGFQLETVVSHTGRYVYTLEVADSAELAVAEPVPVEVTGKAGIKVLIINGYPTFETRGIRELLATSGHEVMVRNRLTKGRYSYALYNTTARRKLNVLNKKLLDQFQILIIDFQSYRALTRSEKEELSTAVLAGLGVFIQPDEGLFNASAPWPGFRFSAVTDQENVTITLDDETLTFPRFNYRIIPAFGTNAIVSAGNEAVAYAQSVGKGKVASSVLRHTYPLRLRGDSLGYRKFWNTVLDDLLTPSGEAWLQQRDMACVDEPLSFTLQTGEERSSVAWRGVEVAPLTGLKISGQSEYWIWPDQPGWDHVIMKKEDNDTDQKWFYVHSPGEWQSFREFRRIGLNQNYFNNLNTGEEAEMVKKYTQVNLFWFYLLFLLSAGYLWLEAKL